MKILIVTGGIGSGKSLVSRMLTEYHGIPVYEADSRVKALYSDIPSMLDEIEAALGTVLRNGAGAFVPQKLAEIIFSDRESLRKVEDIVFPHLQNDFLKWASAQEKEVVALESATILEKSQFDGFGDIVLVVDAPKSLRLSRACARDAMQEERILQRMAAQPLMNHISDGGSCSRVDHVIMNDSTVDDLHAKIDDFIEKYGLTKMLL